MVIDTSVFIEFLRAKNKQNTLLAKISDKLLSTTSITLYELIMGAKNDLQRNDINLLTEDLEVLPFDKKSAIQAGKIYNELKQKNKIIEFRDIFIASIAIVNNLEIVTLNQKDFERIENLKISKI